MTVRIEMRGGKLVADIITKGPDGKRIRKRANVPSAIKSKGTARQWAKKREHNLTMHGDAPVAAAPLLSAFAAEWLDACRANKRKPATLDTYDTKLRLHVLPALGAYRLTAIDDAAIQRLKQRMAGQSAKTINDVLGVLSAVLKLAERRGLVPRVPRMEKLKVEQDNTLRFYDFDEWERLVAGADLAGPMIYAAVLLSGEAGLRRGELVALEQADIGPQEITIRWSEWQKSAAERHTGTTKGWKVRRVPMTERLRVAVARARHLRGKRLLWQPSGRRVSLTTIQSWLETACRRAGLPESRDIHKLRHTFCSHLAMRGASAKAIQELAGHADLKTTMRYMHLSPAHKSEAIRLLEQRGGGAGVERDAEKQ